MVGNAKSEAFLAWTSTWPEDVVGELLSKEPATAIVNSVKAALINVLGDGNAMKRPWKAGGLQRVGADNWEWMTMEQCLLAAMTTEFAGRTRSTSRAPATIKELQELIRGGNHGAGYAVLLTAALAFSTRILIGRVSSEKPKAMVVQQMDEPTQECGSSHDLPCLTIAGHWPQGLAEIGHWVGLAPKRQTRGVQGSEPSVGLPDATTVPGHDWSTICSQHPMELTLAEFKHHGLHNHPFKVATSVGGGLCGDICMHLIRWSLTPTMVDVRDARGLQDLLCAERAVLKKLATTWQEVDKPPLGAATDRWAQTCFSLSAIHHPACRTRIGWRDLELGDMVVLASSHKLPLVVLTEHQQPVEPVETAGTAGPPRRRRKRKLGQTYYEHTIYHVGLQDEVSSMQRWIGILHSGGTHWEMLVAGGGGGGNNSISLVLDAAHFTSLLNGSSPNEVDFASLDPSYPIDNLLPDAMLLGACPEGADANVWLDESPRVWHLPTNRVHMTSTHVLTSGWKEREVGESLELEQMKKWLTDVKVSEEFQQANPDCELPRQAKKRKKGSA